MKSGHMMSHSNHTVS